MLSRTLPLSLAVLIGLLAPQAVLAGPKGCPPGLAKKSIPCDPPGRAKRWQIGERLGPDVAWYEVTDWDRYGLSEPRDGSRYIRIDDEILAPLPRKGHAPELPLAALSRAGDAPDRVQVVLVDRDRDVVAVLRGAVHHDRAAARATERLRRVG